MTLAYIGLGANLGDARATIEQAAAALAALTTVTGFRLSPFYSSAPVDADGPDYVNAVAALQTRLTAPNLLRALQKIEDQYGRQRSYRNAPRTLDLDLLLYGSQSINEPDLVVPHPRMHQRAFVLRPLSDLDPQVALPQGRLVDLLANCDDQVLYRL